MLTASAPMAAQALPVSTPPALTYAPLVEQGAGAQAVTSPAPPAPAPAPVSAPASAPGDPVPLPASPSQPTPPPPVVPTLSGTSPSAETTEDAIVVSGQAPATPGDPLEQVNAESFNVTQKVDKAFVGPVALAYRDAVPRPLRRGLRNVLRNLREPVVFINYLLQLKPGKAAETVGRFAINSTLGVAGLFDAAKKRPFNLPYRPNGFANSFGYYGIGQGPFLYLPLLGATTLRDVIGNTLDRLVLPLAVGKPFNNPAVTIPIVTLSVLDERAQFDEEIQALRKTPDPYATQRDYYLKARQAEIDALRGKATPGMKPFTIAPIAPVPAADNADETGETVVNPESPQENPPSP